MEILTKPQLTSYNVGSLIYTGRPTANNVQDILISKVSKACTPKLCARIAQGFLSYQPPTAFVDLKVSSMLSDEGRFMRLALWNDVPSDIMGHIARAKKVAETMEKVGPSIGVWGISLHCHDL